MQSVWLYINDRNVGDSWKYDAEIAVSIAFSSKMQCVRSHPGCGCPDASTAGNISYFRICNLQKP